MDLVCTRSIVADKGDMVALRIKENIIEQCDIGGGKALEEQSREEGKKLKSKT